MKLDILAFAAHPDDIELACAGTIIKQVKNGSKVGIIDLTEGELGSRGSREIRKIEASNSSEILGTLVRKNLNLGDGFFEITEENLLKIIIEIRKHQPTIVLCNALKDRHPDHSRGGELVKRACFLAGLVKIETTHEGKSQEKWRPNQVFHYIQDEYIDPDFVIDISDEFEEKMKAILCFSSQFYDKNSNEPETPISSQSFMDHIKGRAIQFGRNIGKTYGEGFTSGKSVSVGYLENIV